VCSHDNQFTCFNPTYCPVEQWLELRSGHLSGNIVTHTQVFDPEKPVSLLFDAMWTYWLWLWRPGLGKDLDIK
jgi:hypothetical protein